MKRILLLLTVALLMVVMTMVMSPQAFANNKSDCERRGGTWIASEKKCTGLPVGGSQVVTKEETSHDAGNGAVENRQVCNRGNPC